MIELQQGGVYWVCQLTEHFWIVCYPKTLHQYGLWAKNPTHWGKCEYLKGLCWTSLTICKFCPTSNQANKATYWKFIGLLIKLSNTDAMKLSISTRCINHLFLPPEPFFKLRFLNIPSPVVTADFKEFDLAVRSNSSSFRHWIFLFLGNKIRLNLHRWESTSRMCACTGWHLLDWLMQH